MMTEQARIQRLLSVVSAAATELPPIALCDTRTILERVRSFRLNIDPKRLHRVMSSPVKVRDVARDLNYASEPVLAVQMLRLAVEIVDQRHHAARVFLDNVAEWLLVPPAEYRRLKKAERDLSAAAPQAA